MADHAATAEHVAHQFDDAGQQKLAAELGMWIFLATEVMFFGGMILGYTMYRYLYPVAFAHGSQRLSVVIGGINTGVLLLSSFTVALSVHAARTGARRLLLAALGGLVPGIHFTYAGPDAAGVGMFFWLYFALTGVHALHLTIGIGVMAVIATLAWRGRFTPAYHNPVEIAGLYWHFVDVVWIFLLPLLYLVGRHAP